MNLYLIFRLKLKGKIRSIYSVKIKSGAEETRNSRVWKIERVASGSEFQFSGYTLKEQAVRVLLFFNLSIVKENPFEMHKGL